MMYQQPLMQPGQPQMTQQPGMMQQQPVQVVVAQAPQVVIQDKLMWNSRGDLDGIPTRTFNLLGQEHICEMPNCGRMAYTCCNDDMRLCCNVIWSGCGKKLCERHITTTFIKPGKHQPLRVAQHLCKYAEGDIDESGQKVTN